MTPKLLVGSVIVLFSVMPCRASDDLDNDFEERPWTEIEAQLPAFPQTDDLVKFQVGAVSGTQFFVDAKSLSVGADGVMRYTLVVISASGAENISYEGMRCATAERRSYAFGRPDKTWSKARGNQWVKVRGTSNNVHVDLYSNFLCTVGGAILRTPEDILRVFRKGGNSRY